MPLELQDIKRMHEKAFIYSSVTRERASDDLVFYWITQWDDSVLSNSQLGYRGEFNVLRKAGRQILADLASNPVQVDFVPINETDDSNGDVLDGLYRTDDNNNSTLEAYETGVQEAVVCGVGGWELYTAYESQRTGSTHQVIRRRPLHEANNTVFYDPNAKLLDKSDGKYVSILTAYSLDGYKDLVKELTGEELEHSYESSFGMPEHSYTFPWINGSHSIIYIVSFYYKELVNDNLLTLTDSFNQTLNVQESTLKEVMDDLLDAGYTITSSKKIKRFKVTKYIASGTSILKSFEIPGECIPVVPVYGERAIIEGEEHWEGVTRLAKDPSRLRNFAFSYLADILSRSPRQKPIFFPEQIAGFEKMYRETGSENNYPYLLQNRKDANGVDLPLGTVAVMPEQSMPTPLPLMIQLTKEAIENVADPGLPRDIAEPDTSGKAVLALQARLDMQSLVYQEHLKHAKRYDGMVYASMASIILDVPRTVLLTKSDGSKQKTKLYDVVIDKQTGDTVTLNNLSGAEFEVYSKIGPSYHSQKEQTIDRLSDLISKIEPGNPIRQAMMLKSLKLMDGIDFDDIREYANTQLIVAGVRKPETPEEEAILKQAQEAGNKESAEMVLAKAEGLKAQAGMYKIQTDKEKIQLTTQNEELKRKIQMFEAQTERMAIQIKAQEAGAKIQNTSVGTEGKKIDNASKVVEFKRLSVTPDISLMSNEELFKQLGV